MLVLVPTPVQGIGARILPVHGVVADGEQQREDDKENGHNGANYKDKSIIRVGERHGRLDYIVIAIDQVMPRVDEHRYGRLTPARPVLPDALVHARVVVIDPRDCHIRPGLAQVVVEFFPRVQRRYGRHTRATSHYVIAFRLCCC